MKHTVKAEYIIAEIINNPKSTILVLGAPDFSGSMRLFAEKEQLEGFKQGDRVEATYSYKTESQRTNEVKNDRPVFIELIKNRALVGLRKVGE